MYSLSTIVKISKTAGVLLKPHVSLLVVSLLESITTLEPQMMNYLSLHAAANQAAAEKALTLVLRRSFFPRLGLVVERQTRLKGLTHCTVQSWASCSRTPVLSPIWYWCRGGDAPKLGR